MNEPDNILRFKAQTLHALGKLYAAHPRRQFLLFSDLFGEGGPTLAAFEAEFSETPDPRVQEGIETIRWLLRHGYIDGAAHQFGARDAGLTPKAWASLDKPDPLDPSTSMGAKVVAWAKGAASEGSKAGASALGSAAIAAIGKSLGVPGF
ncbi:hypothetical protein V5G24_23245 [Xanthobacter sp. VTT E-85241]|uniref:hypothetical protein n=1 Tax=Roseixanthobacter finlandensis TaxID=3119922 RepID=UPI00372CC260